MKQHKGRVTQHRTPNVQMSWTVEVVHFKILGTSKHLIYICGFCRILWATPLIHLFQLEETWLQLLAPVLTWIHYKRRRQNQPKLSLVHLLRQPFWLVSHYFTNLSFCPINQSEFCGRQWPQKWTNRGLYSRRSFPPSPLPDPPFFAWILFLLPYPLPFLRLLRRLN